MPIEDDAAEEAGDAEVCLRFPFGALVREDALGLDFPGKPLRRNRPAVTVCSICQKKSRQRKVLHVVRSCAWCIASSCAACIGLPEEEGVREQTGHLQWLCPVDAHRFWRGAQGSAAECRVSAPHFELLRVAASGRKAADRRQLTAPASTATMTVFHISDDHSTHIDGVCCDVPPSAPFAAGADLARQRRADPFADAETCLGHGPFQDASRRVATTMRELEFTTCNNCDNRWFGRDWSVNASGLCTTCVNSGTKAEAKYGARSGLRPSPWPNESHLPMEERCPL
jgi:hypothetical protein